MQEQESKAVKPAANKAAQPGANKAPNWEQAAALKSQLHFAVRVSDDMPAMEKALELLKRGKKTRKDIAF